MRLGYCNEAKRLVPTCRNKRGVVKLVCEPDREHQDRFKSARRRPLWNSLSFSKSVKRADIRLLVLPCQAVSLKAISIEEALQNAEEAIEGYLEAIEKQVRMMPSLTTVQYAKVAV